MRDVYHEPKELTGWRKVVPSSESLVGKTLGRQRVQRELGREGMGGVQVKEAVGTNQVGDAQRTFLGDVFGMNRWTAYRFGASCRFPTGHDEGEQDA